MRARPRTGRQFRHFRVRDRLRYAASRLATLHSVLILSTQATAFGTSCYVLAAGPGSPCLVLDPGAGAADEVARLVGGHDLTPVAVAATHGHPDHIWDAAAVSTAWGIPFLLAEADLDRLAEPAAALGPGMSEGFTSLAGTPWHRPDARALPTGDLATDGLDLGVSIELVAAPGHTPGSTIFLVHGTPSRESVLPQPARRALPPTDVVAFTGDVLFAGSIGRVDLVGGHGPTMIATLRRLTTTIPGEAWVLPGHGPISTMAAELATNPYLHPRWLASGVL